MYNIIHAELRNQVFMAENDNGVTFALEDEDHTLANALRFFLNKK